MASLRTLPLLVVSVLLSGCPGSEVGDADTGVKPADVGVAGADAAVAGADTGVDEVARCKEASSQLKTLCPNDGQRTCHMGAYASFCQGQAAPDLLANALDCLRQHSSATGCRTFSDPSGAESCVATAYAGKTSADVDAVAASIKAKCPTANAEPAKQEPPLHSLTPAQLAALKTCLDAAGDCTAVEACKNTAAGAIAACY